MKKMENQRVSYLLNPGDFCIWENRFHDLQHHSIILFVFKLDLKHLVYKNDTSSIYNKGWGWGLGISIWNTV